MRISIAIVLSSLLLISGCARFSYVEKRLGYKNLKRPYVRVRILETSRLEIKCTGPYELYCIFPEGKTTDYFSNSGIVISSHGSYMSVRERSGLPLESRLRRVVALPADSENHLLLNGKAFRGIADVIIENDSLVVINAIYMEDYLKGVLPPEIGRHGRDELEALKAQAVASRTYALSRFRRDLSRPYDMVNEVADQVYTGMDIEDRWINSAIEKTKGEVLLSGDDLITAYYHSTCGGATDNIEDVWEKQARSYLKARQDNLYCSWSKFYRWSVKWSPDELEISIAAYLKSKGRLRSGDIKLVNLKVIDRLKSGRIRILKVMTVSEDYLLFKDQIRWALLQPGTTGAILPSTNFEITIERDTDGLITAVNADGYGNGHGVGMCQCGALGRSREGLGYRDILLHYYTDVDITAVY